MSVSHGSFSLLGKAEDSTGQRVSVTTGNTLGFNAGFDLEYDLFDDFYLKAVLTKFIEVVGIKDSGISLDQGLYLNKTKHTVSKSCRFYLRSI